jgi:hypothetical protein
VTDTATAINPPLSQHRLIGDAQVMCVGKIVGKKQKAPEGA